MFQDGIMISARLSHLESMTWDGHILVALPSKQGKKSTFEFALDI